MYYFIGSLFPKNLERKIYEYSKGNIDNAANSMQWNFIEGFKQNNCMMEIVTLPGVGTFPKNYSKMIVHKYVFAITPSIAGNSLSFLTFPLLGLVSRYYSLSKFFNREKRLADKDVIIVYSLKSAFLLACCRLKKKFKNLHICVIVPDLPQYMSESGNIVYRCLKRIDKKLIDRCLNKSDSFVLISDAMHDSLNLGIKPWVRIEGISGNNLGNILYIKHPGFVYCYTGTLDKRYGILNLLHSFMQMDGDDLMLWICGKGNAEESVKECSEKDNRIKYFGILPHEEVLKKQKEATVLVNPRTGAGEYTKYSFPSKTMEYMASGTPCIMYDLPALPEEYKRHIFLIDDDQETSLLNKMRDVYSIPKIELEKYGEEARMFIKREKNPKRQVSLMLNMINQ